MNCPLCKNSVNDILSQKLRKGEEVNVYYCPSCDLGFLNDLRTDDEIRAYYAKKYRQEYTPKLNTLTNAEELFYDYVDFQQERIRLIEPYLGAGKRLLEIGCSAGMFLYHIRGLVKEAVGLDFDKSSAEFAQKKCNCEVYTDELIRTPLKKGSFDVICAFQVLEHVKAPLDFIFQVREYLKDDGILYIEVPNLKDILVSTYDLKYHHQFYFHAAHLFYFTKKSLDALLEKAGFSGNTYFMQDYNIVNHFNWIVNDRPQADCQQGLSRPQFPLRKNIPNNVERDLNGFLDKYNQEYKALLAGLELTSNVAYIGQKKYKSNDLLVKNYDPS